MQLPLILLVLPVFLVVIVVSVNHQLSDRHGFPKEVSGKRFSPSAVAQHVLCRSFLQCCSLCRDYEGCHGVAYTEGECQLLNTTCDLFREHCSACHYKVIVYGPVCGDCRASMELGHTDDGVQTLSLDSRTPFQAFCDMTGGGWTVIQRRVDGSVDFYRSYQDYVAGFGDPSGNVWVGLDNIHALTLNQDTELFVTMETFEDESAYAQYSTFSVGDALSGYLLTVSGYNGTAGDSMKFQNQKRFSPYDNDVDTHRGNCAVLYTGAWWYADCHQCNPNGQYLSGPSAYGKSVIWYSFKGHGYSLKYIEFKVRKN